ncbi:MAG TPA: cyclic nucleotide-binding domain-containing protein [Gaiellaceae bacterium]|nr:cyclic nucleotide-binding domain-containing protein [Gaiellaceae bacterium]
MALRKDAKTKLLESVPLFAGCSRKELGEVALIADEMDFREGKTLITEGERGREFFVLVDGTAKVTRGGRRVRELSAGSFFGEIALVSDVPRTATVTSTSPVRVLVITDRAFEGLMRRVPSIAIKVLAALAERVEPASSAP